jgi:hypothetical protein
VQSPSAVYPKTCVIYLELLARTLVQADIGSFHSCRFLCCTSAIYFTVRTASRSICRLRHLPSQNQNHFSALNLEGHVLKYTVDDVPWYTYFAEMEQKNLSLNPA